MLKEESRWDGGRLDGNRLTWTGVDGIGVQVAGGKTVDLDGPELDGSGMTSPNGNKKVDGVSLNLLSGRHGRPKKQTLQL